MCSALCLIGVTQHSIWYCRQQHRHLCSSLLHCCLSPALPHCILQVVFVHALSNAFQFLLLVSFLNWVHCLLCAEAKDVRHIQRPLRAPGSLPLPPFMPRFIYLFIFKRKHPEIYYLCIYLVKQGIISKEGRSNDSQVQNHTEN